FAAACLHGIPVVVAGMEEALQHVWTPEFFIKHYGNKRVALVDTMTDKVSDQVFTVADFFQQFGKYDDPHRKRWKMKDWTPAASFKVQFEEWYRILLDALPPQLRDWMRGDGRLNLIAHFVKNGLLPDIGPKIYNALCCGIGEDDEHAMTNLHEDMSCAFNVMLYSEPCRDGSPGAARWDIIHPDDTDMFRAVAVDEGFCDGKLDPIHSQ
ncbi:hypothetical protein OF83DRAFT_1045130, partial [Amylostereum chailletii]